MAQVSVADASQIVQREVYKYLARGQFQKAFNNARRLYLESPESFVFARLYAALLGDHAQTLPRRQAEQQRAQAVRLLGALMKKLRSIDPELAFRTRNEFYFHSRQYLKQYRLGVRAQKAGLWKAFFSEGVGALYLAQERFERGDLKGGLRWAEKARVAWERGIRSSKRHRVPIRYDIYWFYALSLGFLGKDHEYALQLRTSAQAAGLSLSHRDFRDARSRVARVRRRIVEISDL